MKIDSGLTKDIARTAADTERIAAAGFDGVWLGETSHDVFLQCLEVSRAVPSLTVGSAVAIAFARTPMTLAYSGFDLARYTQGHFVLGLGSQVKAHIEHRFNMPWSAPADRMRELVLAIKAIWSSWETDDKLDFRGEFYHHTLMPPMFSPNVHEFGPPPIFLAGVGEKMTEVAGEVADGFFVHPFTTRRYLDEVTIPALLRGRAKVGKRDLSDFVICGPSFVMAGTTEQELEVARAGTRRQIAFYGSTPAYLPVLELHGWGEVMPALRNLSKAGGWEEMGSLITDEMLAEFAITGTPAQCGAALVAKLGDIMDRATLYATYEADTTLWPELVDAVHAASAQS